MLIASNNKKGEKMKKSEFKTIVKEISEFGEMNDLQVDQYTDILLGLFKEMLPGKYPNIVSTDGWVLGWNNCIDETNRRVG